jgi:hypothetical protein
MVNLSAAEEYPQSLSVRKTKRLHELHHGFFDRVSGHITITPKSQTALDPSGVAPSVTNTNLHTSTPSATPTPHD